MKILALPTLVLALVLSSCGSSKQSQKETAVDDHNAQTSLDWSGIYKGTLPCADCEGISTTVTLNENGTFSKEYMYLGKETASTTETGKFTWNKSGNSVTLEGTAGHNTYFVNEGSISLLDFNGKKNTGVLAPHYNLAKVGTTLINTKWKLVELEGKDVRDSDAFIFFTDENSRVYGNSGCNSFNGSFIVKNELQISFSKMASTMMACPDMEIEQTFMDVLSTVDNLSLHGDKLTLNKARMMPLAVFEAVPGK